MSAFQRPSRIPVRGSLVLALTIGGLTLLLGFRSPQDPAAEMVLALDPSDDVAVTPATLAPETPAPETPAPTSDASPWTSPEPSLVPSPSPSPTPTPSPSVSPSPEATPSSLTATGDAIEFRWGAVQVVVTVEGDQIVDVRALEMPDGDRRSASISQQVEPILREYALVADSAEIDVVSGATYTSLAYAYSLQSALDQLGAG